MASAVMEKVMPVVDEDEDIDYEYELRTWEMITGVLNSAH